MRTLACLSTAVAVLLGASGTAHAGEVTRVATAFEDDNKFDFHFGVAYDFQFKQAAILREWNTGAPTDTSNRLVKDLVYRQYRHVITPSIEFGLFRDLAVYTALPIVAADTRFYAFDQRDDNCTFVVTAGELPNCVNKGNSTTIRDGIIPRNGFDATDDGNPFGRYTGEDTEEIFRGPVRRGLDQLHVGLKYGILNQAKFAHLPNWVIAVEGRFAVGRSQSFSRDIRVDTPEGNTRVGRRIHEAGVWTALSRRYRFLEPFFTAQWRQAWAAGDSLFDDFGTSTQANVQPQSHAGVGFGTEIVPWERKAKQQKVSIFLRGSADLSYGGRGFSEVWELLADSPAMVGATDPAQAEACRTSALAYAGTAEYANNPDGYLEQAAGATCTRFSGTTDIQNFGTFGLDAALNFHLGRYARLMLGANLTTDTRHFITYTPRGKDLDGDGLVEGGTNEVNPLRRDTVDNAGRRYAVDDVLNVYPYLHFMLTF
jgi:hypothetical protein